MGLERIEARANYCVDKFRKHACAVRIICEPAPVDAVDAMKAFIADSRIDLALREMVELAGKQSLSMI